MSTTIRDRADGPPDDADAGLLLAGDLPCSVVDSLFALSQRPAEEATALDRAVVSRLQQALADRMRSIVGSNERQAA